MRTLTLLAALLLAFQARAQTMEKRDDMDSTEDQPWDDDEDMAVSFTGEERFAREAAGPKRTKICRCARGLYCRFREHEEGSCTLNRRIFRLCCK